MFNLGRRDADVALRPGLAPPDTLIGRRVAEVAFAVYASPAYLARAQAASGDLRRHIWVAPDDSLGETQVVRWLRSTLPSAAVALYADSLLALRDAAAAGIGVAALPCYLGDTSPQLVRMHPPIREMTTELWLLTHADLRRTARVRAFVEFAGEALVTQRPLIEGRAVG
jgi:DNA-binding transcriptional LysR family regulator